MPAHPAHPADHPGPLAFVADLEVPVLLSDDAHHLGRVLRLRHGDPLVVGDGAGAWRPARFGASIEPTGPIEHAAPAVPAIGVAFALTKGDKPELVVQKLTELGVDRIVPFRAARSVVQWDEPKAQKAVTRLRTVARAAAMQCHRPWLPRVELVGELGPLLAEPGAALADRGAGPPSLDRPLMVVGPEGGWSPAEREEAVRHGVPSVTVSEHVLRAETAAVTAGALLTALRAGLAGPGGRAGE